MPNLRPHHLLCLRQFDGSGYDETFIKNMRRIAGLMALENGSFVLVSEHDDICAACPNRTAQNTCALDEADVQRMDHVVIDLLDLQTNKPYVYSEITKRLKDRITPASYEACCGSCRWHRQGICSYQKLMERLATK